MLEVMLEGEEWRELVNIYQILLLREQVVERTQVLSGKYNSNPPSKAQVHGETSLGARDDVACPHRISSLSPPPPSG